MKDLAKMRRERQKLIDAMRTITAAAEARDDKRMTEQEAASWQQHDADVQRMADEIKRAERENQLEAEGASENNEGRQEDRTDEFRSPQEFIEAVIQEGMGRGVDPRLSKRAITGMNTVNPHEGGYAVGKDMLQGIMKRTYDVSELARRCSIIQCGANSNGVSWLSLDESSRAAGSRYGGVRAYRVAEGNTVTQTISKMKRSEIQVEKLMAIVPLTEEVMSDATAILSLINEIVPEEFAYTIDDEILTGTGAGQCLGVLNSDALVAVAKEAGQAASTIVYENIVKMRARLWAKSRSNSVWFINQDCEPQLHTMALVVGAGGVPVYMPATSAAPQDTLFGRPVVPIEQAKTVGTTGDILLADMSQYRLVEKGGLLNDESIHVRFIYGERLLRFTKRINGMPLWNKPLTPANGTNTLSPMVSLATRA
jgi:HK97 family phage major capsid protein